MEVALGKRKIISFLVIILAEGKNIILSQTPSEGTWKALKFPKNYKGISCGELQLAETDSHAKSCASYGFVYFTVTL